MYLNQTFGVRRALAACAAVSALLAFGGCSLFHHGQRDAAIPPPPMRQTETTAAAPESMTDHRGRGRSRR